jgi:hypothetical protein
MRPTEESSDQEDQTIESLRQAALGLVRAGGTLVRTGKMAGHYQVEHRGFTVCYYTPFNRPVPRLLRTERQRALAEIWPKRRFRYGLTISEQGECLRVAWDTEDQIFVLWFREDCQKPWDVRFLRCAEKYLRSI